MKVWIPLATQNHSGFVTVPEVIIGVWSTRKAAVNAAEKWAGHDGWYGDDEPHLLTEDYQIEIQEHTIDAPFQGDA